jgi:hypothetical protein
MAKVLTVSTRGSGCSGLSETEGQNGDDLGQPVVCRLCRLSELRHHPSYAHLGFSVPAARLSVLGDQDELMFREPLAITRDRIVVDGYARLELARLQGRQFLPCVEYDLTEEEALRWLLQKQRRFSGMNDFCRILLAMELEPSLRIKALSNQRFGGRMKGSSNLTEDAVVDVRAEIAAAAGVSVGNVTKVRQLVNIGHPELRDALRDGEVSIHRAWRWIKESPGQQIDALKTYQAARGVNQSIRNLISQHKKNQTPTAPNLGSLVRRLSELKPYDRNSVMVSVIQVPGKMIFVTEELIQSLPPYQESMAICTIGNR